MKSSPPFLLLETNGKALLQVILNNSHKLLNFFGC